MKQQPQTEEQSSNKPLWVRLNEERTQGEWYVKDGDKKYGSDRMFPSLMMGEVCKGGWHTGNTPSVVFNNSHDQEHESIMANVEYTALAVNNLHILANQLERILNIEDGAFGLKGFNVEKLKAEIKEALAKIS